MNPEMNDTFTSIAGVAVMAVLAGAWIRGGGIRRTLERIGRRNRG